MPPSRRLVIVAACLVAYPAFLCGNGLLDAVITWLIYGKANMRIVYAGSICFAGYDIKVVYMGLLFTLCRLLAWAIPYHLFRRGYYNLVTLVAITMPLYDLASGLVMMAEHFGMVKAYNYFFANSMFGFFNGALMHGCYFIFPTLFGLLLAIPTIYALRHTAKLNAAWYMAGLALCTALWIAAIIIVK